jgi:hypothetical protein
MSLSFQEFDGRWKHRDEWKQAGDGFLIVVSRQTSIGYNKENMVNEWCVYAYIYPSHPLFDAACKCPTDKMWCEQPLSDLPFHVGISKKELHFNQNGEITAVQLGADYAHIDDQRFEFCGTKEEVWRVASVVFNDAFQLFNHLSASEKSSCSYSAS